MNDFGKGRPLQLLPKLMEEREKTCLLALDAFNLLSLEIIQNQECLPFPVLESIFLKRRQLCIDIQTSQLRTSTSLAATLAAYEVETLPAEFPIALLWDEAPISSSICDTLLKLTGEVQVTLPEEVCSLHLISLTLSKGTLAVSLTPGSEGRVNVNAEENTIEMRPEDFILFASQWEIKPELAFFAKRGPVVLPTVSAETRADIETQVHNSKSAALEAPVPSIVLENEDPDTTVPPDFDGQDGWQCSHCGQFNENHALVCGNCGVQTLDVGEEQGVEVGNPVEQAVIREFPPESEMVRIEPIREDPRKAKSAWKCRYCTLENPEAAKVCQGCSKTNLPPDSSEAGRKQGWTCEYCTLQNKESARICDACAKTRKDLLPPSPRPEPEENTTPTGYWKCEECKYAANGSTDTRCYKCKAARSRQRNTPTAGKADGWICSVCQEENFSFSRTCLSCKTPKPTESTGKTEARGVDMYPEQERTPPKAVENARNTWRCERCKLDVDSSRSYCGKCYALKPTPALERELNGAKASQGSEQWTCSHCQHVNRPTHTNCLMCKEPRPEIEEVKVEKGWVCKVCSRKNPDQRTMCLGCYEQKPAEEQKSAKYDNWTCGRCRTSNIYYDTTCKKCRVAKEAKAPISDRDMEHLEYQAIPSVPAKVDIPIRGQNPKADIPRSTQAVDIDMRGKARPGAIVYSRLEKTEDFAGRGTFEVDVRVNKSSVEEQGSYWDCPSCHTNNLPSAKACYSCRKLKSEKKTQPALPVREPEPKPTTSNYWDCQGCGKQNFRDDKKCYSCELPKDAEVKWTCAHCGTKNEVRATYCIQCYKERQTEEKQPANRGVKQSIGWTCGYCQMENKSTATLCSQCHRSIPNKTAPYSNPRTKTCSKCHQPTTQGNTLCTMCENEAKYRSPKSWTCPKCRIAMTGTYCTRCYASKPRT